jgi:Zn-dependent protease
MAWQDRPYYRDHSHSTGNPLMWLLVGSVPIGTLFGIQVRLHASMILFAALVLVLPSSVGGFSNSITLNLVLFSVVLLHEFGHCFASRWVGGDPQEIILTPIGGLAMADAPHRPGATLVTVMGGPAVNVLICLITGVALALMGVSVLPWNLFNLHEGMMPRVDWLAYGLWFVFAVSWALLLFNLWPIFPLDGGQMLQAVLWWKIGYYKATLFACATGMVGAVLMAMVGLAGRQLLLLFIAVSGFIVCYQIRRELKAQGPWAFEEEEADYSASLGYNEPPPPEERHRRLSRRAVRRTRRILERERAERDRLDAILAKVSAQGMGSLTWAERRTLHKATERRRQQDMELSNE